MGARTRQYLCLLTVIVIGWVSCSPVVPPDVGEYPVALQRIGQTAYLVTAFRDDSPASNHIEARLYKIDATANIELVSEFELPLIREPRNMAAVVTDESGTTSVYGIQVTNGDSSLAFYWSGTTGATIPLQTALSQSWCAGESLGLVRRAKNRSWLFFTERNADPTPSATGCGGEGPPFPLISFEGNTLKTVADDVVWAHCGGEWCQQLRLEKRILRLYAAPITDDSYLKAVTEASLDDPAVFPVYNEDIRYESCATHRFGTLLAFNDFIFALSETEPTLARVGGNLAQRQNAVESDCVDERVPAVPGKSMYRPYEARFLSGETLWVYEEPIGGVEDPACSWTDRHLWGCSDIFGKSQTHVVLFDRAGEKVKTFPLHDLRN